MHVPLRLPGDALVVMAGPSGAGKSTWASKWFRPSQIVSSDTLRGVVGEHTHDLRASADAFALLDDIVERRLNRGLLTVIDTLGMDRTRIEQWLEMAARHNRSTHLVRFDVDAAICRKRNRGRRDPVPSKVLTAQLATWDDAKDTIADGFGSVHIPGPVAVVARSLLNNPETTSHGHDAPLSFGLSISTFEWPGGSETMSERLGQIAAEAEHAGFESIWVMDHFMQIPQVGRDWDAMLEAYTVLSWLAGRTTRMRIGALVTCITHRNLAHLGKVVASLDVLSGGRAMCGLGIGWFEREHHVHGYRFPPVGERYEMLEDALEFLPLQWGPGTPPYSGRHFATPEARCYPRPLQEHIPIMIGGSGEQRTLKLVAAHADACNLFGDPSTISHKVEVLRGHCEALDRDPNEIQITQLSPLLNAPDERSLQSRIDELRPANMSPEAAVDRLTAATTDVHIDRFRQLANAGVDQVIVSLADVGHEGSVADFAPIIDAFRP